MKIFRKLMAVSAVAAVVLGLVACGGGNEKKSATLATKENMIPDNAVVALKVMPEQLWDKAVGDPDSQISKMLNMAKLAVSMNTGELDDFGKALADVIKDPAALGVNLGEPVVVSLSGDFEKIAEEKASLDVYVTALLSDKNAFVSFLDTALAFAEENEAFEFDKSTDAGYAYYEFSVEQDGLYVDLGVTSESLVFRLSYDTLSKSKNLKKSMSKLFAGGAPEKTDALTDFYATKADLSVWADVEGLLTTLMPAVEMSGSSDAAMLEESMPMYKHASIVSTWTLNDGQTVIDLKSYGSEEMVAYAQKYNDIASDKYFKYLPESSVFVANVAIKNFPGLVEEICKTSPEYEEVLEYLDEPPGIDEEFFAGCPGLLTFALDGHDIDRREIPGFIAYVECGENVWELIESNLDEAAELVGYNQYSIDDRLYVAYDGVAVILVEAETLRRSYAGGISSFASTPYASQIRNGGFVFNVAALPYRLLDRAAEEISDGFRYYMTGRDLLEYISSMVVTMSDDHMSSTVTLNMGDKEHNLLEKLVEEFATIATR